MSHAPSIPVSRRRFIAGGALGAGAALCPALTRAAPSPLRAHDALFWEARGDGAIECMLCPWHCRTVPGTRGRCGVRENRDGAYKTLVYGYPVAMHNDPIEKKPLFHVLPGSRAFSIATVGCNIECKFCQNWDISQADPGEIRVPYRAPADIALLARRAGARTVAYTYSEPTIYYEYMLDCARAVKDAGLRNVVVSNGFIEAEPLKQLAPLLAAMKVDLKAFTQDFYGRVCSGQLAPVQATLKRLKAYGVWLEIVVLVIPTLNDDLDDIKRMAAWISKELGPEVPLFFTRFHPDYKLRNLPPTPVQTIRNAGTAARAEGLRFVYSGNMPGAGGENTLCPDCGAAVVTRYGHMVLANTLEHGACPQCGRDIPGVWE